MTRPRSSVAIPNDRILFGEAYWWNQARKHRRLAVMLRVYGAIARSLPTCSRSAASCSPVAACRRKT